MTKLTTAQQGVLDRIVQSGNGIATTELDRRTIAALLKRGYIESAAEGDGEKRVIMTDTGRSALSPLVPLDAKLSASPAEPSALAAKTKTQLVIDLLKAPGGATISQLVTATGWMPHSVRGFISGTLKKKLGLTVASDRADGGRVYSLSGPEASA